MMVSSLDFRCWRRSPVVFAIYSSFIVLLLTNASVGGFQSQRSFVSPAPARTHLDSASQGGLESTTKFKCTTDATAKEVNQRRIMLQQLAKIATLPTAAATIIYPPALAAATETTTTIAHTITDSSVVLNNDGSRIQGWSYKYKWGCYHPERTFDSGLSNTIEGFDNNQGKVVWRKAGFSFDEDLQPQQNLTFGVFGPDLLDGPGGVFFGLIKDTDKWIRPSFLGQTGYKSFCVDLRDNSTLTLSKQAMILGDDYIPLTRDLNRRYKAPVVHYIAKAAGFIVNGLPLKLDDRTPTYVIFDTGLSGMAVSDELYQGRNLQARKNREKSLWGEVKVSFQTKAGDEVELSARKPITTPLGQDTPWTKFKGNLIVLGLAFLDGTSMSIDIDDNKLQLKK
eukprot:scaffold8624_cov121-Skeletonema_marinoi.AAC.2